jgi:hypothetical protein
MDRFFIEFDRRLDDEQGQCFGVLKLGKELEYFSSREHPWPLCHYRYQWKRALEDLVSPENIVISRPLITQVLGEEDNICGFWALYRFGEEVRVHDTGLICDTRFLDPDDSEIYLMAGEYETHTDEGSRISEWEIKIEDISRFLVSKRGTSWGMDKRRD